MTVPINKIDFYFQGVLTVSCLTVPPHPAYRVKAGEGCHLSKSLEFNCSISGLVSVTCVSLFKSIVGGE